MVGGQFWSVYVDCDTQQKHFEDPSVRRPSKAANQVSNSLELTLCYSG